MTPQLFMGMINKLTRVVDTHPCYHIFRSFESANLDPQHMQSQSLAPRAQSSVIQYHSLISSNTKKMLGKKRNVHNSSSSLFPQNNMAYVVTKIHSQLHQKTVTNHANKSSFACTIWTKHAKAFPARKGESYSFNCKFIGVAILSRIHLFEVVANGRII